MYKKVELPQGFVGMEKEIANLWNARNVIKYIINQNQICQFTAKVVEKNW